MMIGVRDEMFETRCRVALITDPTYYSPTNPLVSLAVGTPPDPPQEPAGCVLFRRPVVNRHSIRGKKIFFLVVWSSLDVFPCDEVAALGIGDTRIYWIINLHSVVWPFLIFCIYVTRLDIGCLFAGMNRVIRSPWISCQTSSTYHIYNLKYVSYPHCNAHHCLVIFVACFHNPSLHQFISSFKTIPSTKINKAYPSLHSPESPPPWSHLTHAFLYIYIYIILTIRGIDYHLDFYHKRPHTYFLPAA